MADAAPRVPYSRQTVYYHSFASGGSTAGCGEPTIGCERRCARRRDATATPARPSSTARLLRPPRWADRNAATTEREASRRTKAPHPGGHERAGVGCAGSRRRPPRSRRWETIAGGRERVVEDGVAVGRRRVHGRVSRVVATPVGVAPGSAAPPRPAALWRYGLEEKPHGFQVLARRWVVERTTFAWLGLSRRFSKDYERLPETAEAMIYGAMSRIMLRRLARAA